MDHLGFEDRFDLALMHFYKVGRLLLRLSDRLKRYSREVEMMGAVSFSSRFVMNISPMRDLNGDCRCLWRMTESSLIPGNVKLGGYRGRGNWAPT